VGRRGGGPEGDGGRAPLRFCLSFFRQNLDGTQGQARKKGGTIFFLPPTNSLLPQQPRFLETRPLETRRNITAASKQATASNSKQQQQKTLEFFLTIFEPFFLF
jgi:hypothetical protein